MPRAFLSATEARARASREASRSGGSLLIGAPMIMNLPPGDGSGIIGAVPTGTREPTEPGRRRRLARLTSSAGVHSAAMPPRPAGRAAARGRVGRRLLDSVWTAHRSASRKRRGTSFVVSLFSLAMLLLGMAWVLASPTPSGTDEPAHYVKALATSEGEFAGIHAAFPFRDKRTPDVMFFWDQTTMLFRLPAAQAPASTFACTAGDDTTVPAVCTDGPRCVRWKAPCAGTPPTAGTVVVASYLG